MHLLSPPDRLSTNAQHPKPSLNPSKASTGSALLRWDRELAGVKVVPFQGDMGDM